MGARAALGAAGLLLLVHGVNALLGGSSSLATQIFWPVGIGAVAVVVVRAAVSETERSIWIPAAIAFVAWFVGSAYYAGSNRSVDSLSAFLDRGHGPALLRRRGRARGRAAREGPDRAVPADDPPRRRRDRVRDGSALGAALMSETLHRFTVEAHPGVLKLAYPIGALLFLSFAIWVVALSDWRPGPPLDPAGGRLRTAHARQHRVRVRRGARHLLGGRPARHRSGSRAPSLVAVAAWQPQDARSAGEARRPQADRRHFARRVRRARAAGARPLRDRQRCSRSASPQPRSRA